MQCCISEVHQYNLVTSHHSLPPHIWLPFRTSKRGVTSGAVSIPDLSTAYAKEAVKQRPWKSMHGRSIGVDNPCVRLFVKVLITSITMAGSCV